MTVTVNKELGLVRWLCVQCDSVAYLEKGESCGKCSRCGGKMFTDDVELVAESRVVFVETDQQFPSASFILSETVPVVEHIDKSEENRSISPDRGVRRATDKMFPGIPISAIVASAEVAGTEASILPSMELSSWQCPVCGETRTLFEGEKAFCLRCRIPTPVPQTSVEDNTNGVESGMGEFVDLFAVEGTVEKAETDIAGATPVAVAEAEVPERSIRSPDLSWDDEEQIIEARFKALLVQEGIAPASPVETSISMASTQELPKFFLASAPPETEPEVASEVVPAETSGEVMSLASLLAVVAVGRGTGLGFEDSETHPDASVKRGELLDSGAQPAWFYSSGDAPIILCPEPVHIVPEEAADPVAVEPSVESVVNKGIIEAPVSPSCTRTPRELSEASGEELVAEMIVAESEAEEGGEEPTIAPPALPAEPVRAPKEPVVEAVVAEAEAEEEDEEEGEEPTFAPLGSLAVPEEPVVSAEDSGESLAMAMRRHQGKVVVSKPAKEPKLPKAPKLPKPLKSPKASKVPKEPTGEGWPLGPYLAVVIPIMVGLSVATYYLAQYFR